MVQYRTVDLEEVPIHYAEAPGPGPALVILHGITGSHTSFLPLMPTLAQGAHVYALDLRGHNLSGRTPGAYQIPDYGRDVAAFLQRVVGGPAIVVGHSLGGMIAVWAAVHEPDWVQGLFLEDPPLYITQPPRFQQTPFYGFFVFLRDALRQHHANGGTLDDLVAFTGQFPVNEKQTMLEALGPEAVRLRASELQRMDPDTLDPAIDGVIWGGQEPDDLLARVRCPTDLLAAEVEYGGAMTPEDVQRCITAMPHCIHKVFERTGHGIHEERPQGYVHALQQFMAALPAQAMRP
ncbi:MAG: alpha/beta hydrolase [Planctomycetes bacterium]|nr:alpha/beta hydrolase [Planctomycetota bacterium]